MISLKEWIGLGIVLFAFFAGWQAESWKNGAEQKAQLASQLDTVNQQLKAFDADQKQTTAHDIALGTQLQTLSSASTAIRQEIQSEKNQLANPVSAACVNPFTPDFLRLLNSSPDTSAPAAATGH